MSCNRQSDCQAMMHWSDCATNPRLQPAEDERVKEIRRSQERRKLQVQPDVVRPQLSSMFEDIEYLLSLLPVQPAPHQDWASGREAGLREASLVCFTEAADEDNYPAGLLNRIGHKIADLATKSTYTVQPAVNTPTELCVCRHGFDEHEHYGSHSTCLIRTCECVEYRPPVAASIPTVGGFADDVDMQTAAASTPIEPSSSGQAWREWFDRLGDKATAEVVNATATLVTDERLAALVDARVLPAAASTEAQEEKIDAVLRSHFQDEAEKIKVPQNLVDKVMSKLPEQCQCTDHDPEVCLNGEVDEGSRYCHCECHQPITTADFTEQARQLTQMHRWKQANELPHSCVPIARAVATEEGRDYWIGKLTEPVAEWPKETHCLHMKTPIKSVVFLCNSGDFEQLLVMSNVITGLKNLRWLDSMTKAAVLRAESEKEMEK